MAAVSRYLRTAFAKLFANGAPMILPSGIDPPATRLSGSQGRENADTNNARAIVVIYLEFIDRDRYAN